MRRTNLIWIGVVVSWLLAIAAGAETYQLTDGRTIGGEALPASANEEGVQMRLDDGTYERILWSSFSQDDLRKLVQDRRIAQYAEAFIEISAEEKARASEIILQDVPRLDRPSGQSLLGAMFSSGLGVLVLLICYAANILAAREVAIFRNQPVGLVCGVSAVLPLIGPILFLSMATRLGPVTEEAGGAAPETASGSSSAAPAASSAAGAAAAAAVDSNPLAPAGGFQRRKTAAAEPAGSGLRLEHTETSAPAPAAQTQIFQRGAFTFNRRFFETKFAGFFGMNRRDADKGLVIVVKAAKGTYTAQRITRISSNELHFETLRAGAAEESVPFSEIQEVQLKPKDA